MKNYHGSQKRSLYCFLFLILSAAVYGTPAFGNNEDTLSKKATNGRIKKGEWIDLDKRLDCFYPLQPEASYSISVCADLPDNANPACVYKNKEPGHVFLILEKRGFAPFSDSVIQSFGFYPRRPVSTLIFKKAKAEMLDNSNREYNAFLKKTITAAEFEIVLAKCRHVSKKKYNLNRYNCYDFVVEVFNSLPGIEKLPVTHVKFPFIFGKGGSPCGLYKDLERLCGQGSVWAPAIHFGVFISPASCSGSRETAGMK